MDRQAFARFVVSIALLLGALASAAALPEGHGALAAPPQRGTGIKVPAGRPPGDDGRPRRAAVVGVANARLAIQVGDDSKFNMGAYPDAGGGAGPNSWDLMFSWPDEPWSSLTSLSIDGATSLFDSAPVAEAPVKLDANTIRTRRQVGDVEVTQLLQLAYNPQSGQVDIGKITYTVRNTGGSARAVGLRFMNDVEINYNDGATFRIPGKGIIETERDYAGADVPDTFAVLFNVTDNVHVGGGVLRSGGATAPDRMVIAAWPEIYDTVWDYAVNPTRSVTGDSAYALYWNPTALAPGVSRSYVTYYGLTSLAVDSGPLTLGLVSPATISFVNGVYSPNPFDVVATISNTTTGPLTNVMVTIELPAGLSLASGSATQNLGTLAPGTEKQVSWRVRIDTGGVAGARARSAATSSYTYTIVRQADGIASKSFSQTITLAQGAATWYFAEGYTGTGFDEYLTILNPGDTAATATISYFVEGQSSPIQRFVSLSANSRTTVAVHGDPSTSNPGGLGRLTTGHSTRVEGTVPIVVERPMYFVYSNRVNGGHNVMGATGTASDWYFAEGFTGGGFDEFLTIQNPGASAGTATVSYYVEGETTPRTRQVTLPAFSRTTVVVHADQSAGNPAGLGRLAVGHSTRVSGSVPIVVERPMYFVYGSAIDGGHNVLGANSATTSWYFAEGFTGGGFDEYLTVQNPGAAGSATVSYYVEGETAPRTRTVPLAANSRTTVVVHDDQSAANPGGMGRLAVGHSTRVDTSVPTVVERPMYFSYGTGITDGHNVMGSARSATTWYFAEGFTGGGFDEFLTIQNPGAAGSATVSYYVEGESAPRTRTVPLAANSRTTVTVHGAQSTGNPGGLGRLVVGHSTKVTTTQATVVERPMYFSYSSAITGGHNVLGFAP